VQQETQDRIIMIICISLRCPGVQATLAWKILQKPSQASSCHVSHIHKNSAASRKHHPGTSAFHFVSNPPFFKYAPQNLKSCDLKEIHVRHFLHAALIHVFDVIHCSFESQVVAELG
jgi:tRNA1(Val) A37 N6-methylase TrmN6